MVTQNQKKLNKNEKIEKLKDYLSQLSDYIL